MAVGTPPSDVRPTFPDARPCVEAAAQIPFVLLPLPGDPLQPILVAGPARVELAAARAALASLENELDSALGFDRKISAALAEASGRLRRLAAFLPPPSDPEARWAPPPPVHAYFRVRSCSLSPEQFAAHAVMVMLRAVADIPAAGMNINDALAEVAGATELLSRFERSSQVGHQGSPTTSWQVPSVAPARDALERWAVAHHLYFLFNLCAAAAIRAAIAALALSNYDDEARFLAEAVIYVRALTGAMLHSAAMGRNCYEIAVRPTMQRPAQLVPLTGAMQPEHASYRAALEELVAAVPQTFAELYRCSPAVALARDALFNADLLDLERHVAVAAVLVGNARSLVQREEAPVNAVMALRQMRQARARRYAPLMQFAERFEERGGAGKKA